jgi:PAS domain S-box-containing protein
LFRRIVAIDCNKVETAGGTETVRKVADHNTADEEKRAGGEPVGGTIRDPDSGISACDVEGLTEGLCGFFNLALDLLCVANTDGYFLKLNPAWETTLGYGADELTSVQFLDFVHPDDVAGTMEAISELVSQKKVIDFTNRFRCKDATYRWLQWRSAPSGELIIATARDITEQKRIEDEQTRSLGHLEGLVRERTKELERMNEELQVALYEREKSETRATRFFDLSLDLFSMPGFDGYFKYVNPAWERTLGYTREEILSTPLTEFVHPDDREGTVEEIREIGAGKETMNFENRYRCKDGSYRWLSWSALNIPEEQVMFAVARDITDTKLGEVAVRESKDELEAIYNGLGDGLMVVDTGTSTIVRSNQVLASMLGYSQAELAGMPIANVHPAEELKLIAREVEKGREGLNHVQDLILMRKDGSTFPVDMTGMNINYKGRPSGVAILRDTTERKKAEEALKASEQTLQTIFDSMPGLLFFKNKDNVIVRANKMLADSMRMKVEEIEGRPLSEIFPDQGEEYWKDDLEVIESGKPRLGIEEPFDTPEGTRWLRTDKVPYRDTDGEIVGVVGAQAVRRRAHSQRIGYFQLDQRNSDSRYGGKAHLRQQGLPGRARLRVPG